MTLMSMRQIQQGLDEKFLPLEPMVTGSRLIAGGVSETARAACERTLSTHFPPAFRDNIESFSFGDLAIGPVAFCGTGDYLKELIQLNTQVVWWWGEAQRPADLLLIALSDPYSILLDTARGSVRAFDTELGWRSSTLVASDFDTYLRGVGTAMLLRESVADRPAFAAELLTEVGGTDLRYWQSLVR